MMYIHPLYENSDLIRVFCDTRMCRPIINKSGSDVSYSFLKQVENRIFTLRTLNKSKMDLFRASLDLARR